MLSKLKSSLRSTGRSDIKYHFGDPEFFRQGRGVKNDHFQCYVTFERLLTPFSIEYSFEKLLKVIKIQNQLLLKSRMISRSIKGFRVTFHLKCVNCFFNISNCAQYPSQLNDYLILSFPFLHFFNHSYNIFFCLSHSYRVALRSHLHKTIKLSKICKI